MFTRTIIEKLVEWKNKPHRKPLILRGARQVRKTTAVNIFATHFENYIYLNLEKKQDRDIFVESLSVRELFEAILLVKNISLQPGATLIFIDEIQNSPVALKMLRYFYEELADEVWVIAAGSLMELILEKNQMGFPVGRVEYLYMYPLTFQEFLEAREEKQALEIYNSIPLNKFAFTKLMTLFHQYTLIGGMPEIVQHVISGSDIPSLKATYESLLTSYLDDADKYARNTTMRQILKHCIESIPFEAGKRIKFQGFGNSNYRSREVGEALRLIERAMLIWLIYPSTSNQIPLIPDLKKSPKLQFIDTGLLNFFVGLQPEYYRYDNLHAFYKGLIAEHIVRQELLALHLTDNRKISFWVREKMQSNAEIDVLLPFETFLIPMEIKAGKTGTLKSLHQFIDQRPHPFAVRLYHGDFEIIETKTPGGTAYCLMNLPYFLIGKIHEYLKLLVK